LLLLMVALPTLAITYGQPDGDLHPFVGALVFRVPKEDATGYDLYQWCTGTLIDEQVFLTASHCTFDIDDYLTAYPGSDVVVTFDPTINESSTFYSGTPYTHPDFGVNGGGSDPADIAVIVLDETPPNIEPAQLPYAGMLDELEDQKVLKDTRFTTVGYGTIRETQKTGFQGILDNMDRNYVDQGFNALTKVWLKLPMNYSTDNGGTCYGDSGGPHFIHLNGQETKIVASITVTGDAPCKASDVTYRVDTATAREFLDDFVTLP
jgi:secreted trypsin-like serine protease